MATTGAPFLSLICLRLAKIIKKRNKKIIVFPDKSEFQNWNNKVIELNSVGFKIVVNDWLEHIDYEDGTDFADVYINEVKNIAPEQTEPIIKDLCDYTNTEQTVHRIEQHTPKIRFKKSHRYNWINSPYWIISISNRVNLTYNLFRGVYPERSRREQVI